MLREGDWGRVVRLFYHIFYGEGFVVHPGCKFQREADKRPFAGENLIARVYSLNAHKSLRMAHNTTHVLCVCVCVWGGGGGG